MMKIYTPSTHVNRFLLSLILVFAFSSCQQSKVAPAIANIKSIQAYTDYCWYGQKLTKVDITYQENVDLSNVTPDTYKLLDRGYAHPDFAEATIESLDVDGHVVTLHITTDTEASIDNTMNYIGDNKEGDRTKNPIGLYPTGPWYRGVNESIYFGEKDRN